MKKTVLNLVWLYFQIGFLICILFGVVCLVFQEKGGIFMILLGTVLMIGLGILSPNRYRFDKTGITLYYWFGLRTHSSWEDIRFVSVCVWRPLPWRGEYEIGFFKSKFPLHRTGQIIKNRKTTALIKTFWQGEIDD